MPLTLSDEVLKQAGMTAEEARVEIACRLFEAEKLALWPAAQLARLSRVEFEEELSARRIAIYRVSVDEFQSDLEALRQLDRLK